MKFDLRRPCAQCPFRTDVEPYLRAARAKELERAMTTQQATFACHKTVDYASEDENGHIEPSADEQHCAGALILLEKIDMPNQMMRIAERLGAYDRTKLDMDAPVFDSFAEMKRAQRKNSPSKAKR